MSKPTWEDLDQAFAYLEFQQQHLAAAGSHRGRNRALSDRSLERAIECGALADQLRGDLTWDEVMEQWLFGKETRG